MIHRQLANGGSFGVNHNHDLSTILVQLIDDDSYVRRSFTPAEAEQLIKLLQEQLVILQA